MKGYQLFHILIVLCFFTISCSSDDGGGNNGWITITEPSDSTSYTAENIETVRVSGNMFQSPSGGTVSGTECGCSNIAICFPPICRDYSFFRFALTVTVTNQTTGFSIEANLSEPDFWVAEIPIVYGDNLMEAYVEDVNGINSREHILIEVKDTVVATILARSPENNDINVATTTNVILTFSEPLEPSSITTSSVSLSANGSKVEGLFTFDDVTNVLMFSPNEPLLHNTNYTLSVNNELTDLNGTSVRAYRWRFTTIPMATTPSVKTEDATDVGESSATLWGSVSPNYGDTEAWFEWGADSNLSVFSITDKTDVSALSGNTSLTKHIGLNPGVDYYYRIAASNYAGTSKGNIKSFFTFAPPAVITYPPQLLSPNQLKLTGSVNPNGYTTESSFKISFNPVVGLEARSSPTVLLGDGRQFINIEHEFDQLASGSKYYFRLDANYPNGTATNGVFSIVTPYSNSSCWAKRYHPPASILVGAENEIGFDEITSIDQTLDDGYIIIMESLSYEDGLGGTRGMRILKTNSDGGVEWVRRYSTSSYHKVGYNISTIQQTSTGNYIVAGYHQTGWSLSHSTEVTWIAELDQNGEIVWENRYGDTYYSRDSNWYRPTNIFLLSDGYIVFGTYYGTYEGTSTWMMKLDTDGEPVWSQSYYGSISVVTQVPGGFVMARVHDHDILVTWLDQDGQVQRSKQYGTSLDLVKSIAVSSGTLAIVGKVTNTDDTSDIRAFGIETNGDISWEYIFDGGNNDSATSIHATSDGGFIIGGNSGINVSDEGVVLLKLSLSGILQWQKVYPDKSIPNNHDTLRPVTGGDYIVGVRSVPSQVNTFELIKTDSSGSCSTLDSPSLMIPSLSASTITDYAESSGSGDPTYLWDSMSYQFEGYVEIEQIFP